MFLLGKNMFGLNPHAMFSQGGGDKGTKGVRVGFVGLATPRIVNAKKGVKLCLLNRNTR